MSSIHSVIGVQIQLPVTRCWMLCQLEHKNKCHNGFHIYGTASGSFKIDSYCVFIDAFSFLIPLWINNPIALAKRKEIKNKRYTPIDVSVLLFRQCWLFSWCQWCCVCYHLQRQMCVKRTVMSTVAVSLLEFISFTKTLLHLHVIDTTFVTFV